MIGTWINERYRLDSELGRGGMGIVYRAHDALLARDIAVKVLSTGTLGTEGRARLLSEARATARLNHPNIVAVYDAGEAEGIPYIVMELIQGESIHRYCNRDLGKILATVQQVCNALEHAHSNGIIHRDLKPENVMITPVGSAKLMDFGLAHSVSSRLTAEETLIGTVFYIAPEQALGQELDGRTDLYALGVMLYELTTGQLPFSGERPLAVISQHLHAPVVPPSTYNADLPSGIENLIMQLLSKRPEDRPGSAAQVGETLARCASGTPPHLSIAPIHAPLLLDRLALGRMVGREPEMREARAAWHQATSPTGAHAAKILLISGEPGIGKTRFARELATLAEVSGGNVMMGGCYAEGSAPYAPIAQIVRSVLNSPRADALSLPNLVLSDLITLAPDLHARYPDLLPNPPLNPQAEQQRLLESTISFCVELASQAPLLLIVEDVHWADGGTLLLLQSLARRGRALGARLPLLILLTYREVELYQTHPLNDLMLNLSRERMMTRIKLGRLNLEQTGELLTTIFADEIAPEFVAGIFQETEGNPFFIEEVCKALIEEGTLYREGGRWQSPHMEEVRIPQSVRLAIQSRVSKLPAPAQEILRLAAIVGREFDFATLKKASELSEDTLVEALEAAEQAQLIQEVRQNGREHFAFAHALTPATLRESLSGLRRHRLHRRVAVAIESVHPDDLEALAYHYGEAGDEACALTYTIQAAERARKVFANEEAIRFYTEGLALLPASRPERFQLLGARAQVYNIVARREEQQADVRAMLEIAQKSGDAAQLFDALIALTDFYLETDFSQAFEPAEEAAAIAKSLGDPVREARALRRLGSTARYRHDLATSRDLLEKAKQLFQEAELPREAAICLFDLSLSLSNLGQPVAAKEAAQEAIALSRAAGDRLIEATGLRRLAIVYMSNYQHAKALPIAQAALKLHRELGDRSETCNALNVLGILFFWLGEPEKGKRYLVESFELGEEIGSVGGYLNATENLIGMYYRARRKYEAGLAFVEEQLAKVRRANDPLLIRAIEAQKAHILGDLGQYESAIALVKEALDQPQLATLLTSQSKLLIATGRWAAESGDYEQAREHIEMATAQAVGDTPAGEIPALLVRTYIAVLEGTEPGLSQAMTWIEKAIELLSGGEWRHDLASALGLGALLHLKLMARDREFHHAEKALAFTTEALELSATIPDMDEPVQFFHSLALRAAGRAEEAKAHLEIAYQQVMEVAEQIKTPSYRSSWLERVPANRDILAAWQTQLRQEQR